jgi:adenylate cyclase
VELSRSTFALSNGWRLGTPGRRSSGRWDALERLAANYAEAGASEAAIETAQRQLALDPLREEAHRILMRLYDASGRRSAALKQYQICEELLRRELNAEPEPETVRLWSEIRTRQSEPGGSVAHGEAATEAKALTQRPWILIATAVTMLAIAGGAFWTFYLRGAAPVVEVASEAKMAFPLPQRPSIAVLPFKNLTGDAAEDSFVDGITDDITTVLSTISQMFVIDRGSALTYKGKTVKVQQVAEELGVRYVLEGSVKRSGDRVRVSAQLIDALTGHHLWAEIYDREVEDIFALQDEITLEIVTALEVAITEGEQERISLIHGTGNLQAWVLVGRGVHLARRLTREDNTKARELHRRATQLDPNYPGAWDALAWTHFIDARFGWSDSRQASMLRAAELAQKALALDQSRPRTYALLGMLQLMTGNHDQAVALGQKAVALSPSGAEVAAFLALTSTYTGEVERSIALIEKAMRLSPYYPDWYRWTLGRAYRLMGRQEEAVAALATRLDHSPDSVAPRVELVAAYMEMGREAAARAEAAEVLRINPGFSVHEWMVMPPYKDAAIAKREMGALRRAGLPE